MLTEKFYENRVLEINIESYRLILQKRFDKKRFKFNSR